MKISILLFAIVFFSFIFFGCKIFQKNTSTDNRTDFLVSYAKDGCFGNCPEFELTIFENGDMEYHGIENVEMEGLHSAKINMGKIAELKAKFEEEGFFELKDGYLSNIADLPVISIEYGDMNCEFHQRQAPRNIKSIMNFLEALIEEGQWKPVGD